MNKLDTLYNLAEEAGIQIETWSFPSDLLGIYIKEPGITPVIGLNKDILRNTKLHTCVLAEEIGHYYTTSGNCISPCYNFNERVVLSKKERLAMKWAVSFLIPIEEIVTSLKKGFSSEELMDKLSVTKKFLEYGLLLYSQECPWVEIGKNEYIVFQSYPNVYIYKGIT